MSCQTGAHWIYCWPFRTTRSSSSVAAPAWTTSTTSEILRCAVQKWKSGPLWCHKGHCHLLCVLISTFEDAINENALLLKIYFTFNVVFVGSCHIGWFLLLILKGRFRNFKVGLHFQVSLRAIYQSRLFQQISSNYSRFLFLTLLYQHRYLHS